ncbi:MAG TPA: DEAD/DEAH box helicase family protein [Gemmataceae bacterium]|nr:DEAD/DEAH box helicase family protein [Gemmataceae bacterium]
MNATARKSLRPYQAHLIADVCRADGPVLVEQPTGSGKTMQIVTLVAMQLGQRFTHAVIAAPQQQIEHAFVHPDYRLVAFPNCQGVATPDITDKAAAPLQSPAAQVVATFPLGPAVVGWPHVHRTGDGSGFRHV